MWDIIIQRLSFFIVVFGLAYLFGFIQHMLMSRKFPWIWRVGISASFIILLCILFYRETLSFAALSDTELFFYLFFASSIFLAITIVNLVGLLQSMSLLKKELILICMVMSLFTVGILYFVLNPLSLQSTVWLLKRTTFVSALLALLMGLFSVLFKKYSK